MSFILSFIENSIKTKISSIHIDGQRRPFLYSSSEESKAHASDMALPKPNPLPSIEQLRTIWFFLAILPSSLTECEWQISAIYHYSKLLSAITCLKNSSPNLSLILFPDMHHSCQPTSHQLLHDVKFKDIRGPQDKVSHHRQRGIARHQPRQAS